jgi:hypothetical protein
VQKKEKMNRKKGCFREKIGLKGEKRGKIAKNRACGGSFKNA